jgi:hypothetical protein
MKAIYWWSIPLGAIFGGLEAGLFILLLKLDHLEILGFIVFLLINISLYRKSRRFKNLEKIT